MFWEQIGKMMEMHVNDMLVKLRVIKDYVEHLGEMFDILRKYWMCLNPFKYAFGVNSGKFLGLMVNQWGVKANPDKIQAFLDMQSPIRIKQV